MGKKKTETRAAKIRAKKEAARAEVERQQEAKRLVGEACAVEDQLAELAPFSRFKVGEQECCVECAPGRVAAKETVSECFDLLERNMRELYVSGGWGWKAGEKRRELVHEDAHLLLAYGPHAPAEGDGVAEAKKEAAFSHAASAEKGGATGGGGGRRLLGFGHFRFELEDGGAPVLYIYEIQVQPGSTRAGLGRRLVQLMELVALKRGMQRIMCTVFKENVRSMRFFRTKMKYAIDESSPSNFEGGEDETYEILGKPLKR